MPRAAVPVSGAAIRAGAILAVVGIVFVFVSAGMYVHHFLFLRGAVATRGTVIAMDRQLDSDDHHVTFAPVVRYVAQDGEHTLRSTGGSNPPSFHVGERVTVLIDPQNPGSAMIDSFAQVWFLTMLFGALGTLLLAGAFVIAWKYRVHWMHRPKL